MAFIEIESLNYKAPQGKSILTDIDLSIEKGEYLCIVGANGAGKSTLVRQMNGLLQPSSGQVRINGLSTADTASLPEIRSSLAMVFQNPNHQIISSIVEEDLAFGPENLCWPQEKILQAMEDVMEELHLTGLENRPTHQLSAGQLQRVCLAGAMISSPQGLMLDEASSMLHPKARKEWLKLIGRRHQRGTTLISVTHHMEELLEAQRVLVLREGRIFLDCPPEELLRRRDLQSLGLKALPWTAQARGWNYPEEMLPLRLNDFIEKIDPMAIPHSDPKENKQSDLLARIRGLEYHYPQSGKGVDALDFNLYRGERLILMGNSGSGKTTLLQMLCQVLEAQQGSIEWQGPAPVKGLAFQNPQAQLFKTFAGDDVAFGPQNQGLTGRALSLRVKEAMELCGLDFLAFKDRRILQLSGGEKRKLALAGVLALNPQVLLLDEPSGGLDPQSRDELAALLDTLQARGVTLIIATHHMEEAARGDRVLYLENGQMTALEPTRSFFYDQHRGVTPPWTVELSLKLRAENKEWPELLLEKEVKCQPKEGVLHE